MPLDFFLQYPAIAGSQHVATTRRMMTLLHLWRLREDTRVLDLFRKKSCKQLFGDDAMRFSVAIFTVIGVVLGLVFAEPFGITSVTAQAEENVSFYWAFGAAVKVGNDEKLVPIGRGTPLQTGDRVKMLVLLKKPCFVYVFHHDSQGDVRMLFPYNLQQFSSDYVTEKRYDVPQGNAWFELDEQVGSETFYLLASSKRLNELEDLVSQYASADNAKQSELAPQIVQTIRRVRKRHRNLTIVAERPTPIAGNFRALNQVEGTKQDLDIGQLAVDISADTFYSRTFTIEHN